MAVRKLSIRGMTCDHCRRKVEDALNGVEGVYGVFVDLEAGEAEVTFGEGTAGAEALVGAVRAAGYEAEVVHT